MRQETLDVLRANLAGMQRSIHWLRRSYDACLRIGIRQTYTEEEFDAYENLSGRYARTVDVIISKVLRSIDAVELEDGGTLIDVVNRAEKRGLVASADLLRDRKDLRNDIVHEYETDDLRGLFRQVLEATPLLFSIAEAIDRYCARFEQSPNR